MDTMQRLLLPAAGFALVLLGWEWLGRSVGPAILAPPSLVLVDYIDLLRQGRMLRELVFSLRQMAIGYALACLIGMPLGVLMGRSRLADAVLRP